jgi:hypothetical protein
MLFLSRPELVDRPTGLGHAHDRQVEVATLHHRLQRRKDLLEGKIARGTEEDQGVGVGFVHLAHSPLPLLVGRFFRMSAELESHGRQNFVLKFRLTTRGEALIEYRGENVHRNGLVNRGLDRPPALARVRDLAHEFRERGILD